MRKIAIVLVLYFITYDLSSQNRIKLWDKKTKERAISEFNPLHIRTNYGYVSSGVSYQRSSLPVIGEFYNNTLPTLIKDLPDPIGRYLYDIPKLEGLAKRHNHKWDFVLSVRSDWPGFFGEARSHSGRFSNAGTIFSPKNISKLFSPQKYYEIIFDNYAENSGINLGFEISLGIKPFQLMSGFHDISFDVSKHSKIIVNETVAYNYGIDFTKKAGAELLSNSINYEAWIRERTPDFIENQFDIGKIGGAFAKKIEQSIPAYIFGVPTDKSVRFACEVKYQYKTKYRYVEAYIVPEFTKSIDGYARTHSYSIFFGINIKKL